jgi:uncharacterized SAM-binding protein YcdF (DUF218 family)
MWAKRLKRALIWLASISAFVAIAWFARASWLREAAELWIVSSELGPADAAVVLGGGLSVRSMAAAEDYHNGLVKKVLVANVHEDQAEKLGFATPHTVLIHDALIKLGVPETAVERFGNEVRNTFQEVMALREWALRNHAQSVIVPTQEFSSRRVHWILEHEFAGTGIKIQVQPVNPTDYDYRIWWRSEAGALAFEEEIVKYVYYRLKY